MGPCQDIYQKVTVHGSRYSHSLQLMLTNEEKMKISPKTNRIKKKAALDEILCAQEATGLVGLQFTCLVGKVS